ncbi:large exoprotein containing haemagglutination activity domain [Thioploca ingrica]|uniref:Large exoprotein containing haemagglutination activity domain n=1 Tax=Thioploca ingrica TaxID=40754 RepID=A0A090AM28_9GAMM|nr:large exoprotein containing haemagglutination activity domain [Thioploca ingrica]
MKKTWVISYLMVLLTQSTLYAEIILDGTLGFKDALTGPNYLLDAQLGKQVGANLFHSFSEFNLNADESITFSGPENINNIINRVTGGNPSNINGGLYSTIPNADIYFLNPFGVVFGPNATLNIPGSFHVSTADILYLQEGGKFDATKPSNSLLTSAAPSAFGFLTNSSADLSIQGSKLSISPQNTLSIIGGQVKVDQAQVEAFSGRLNLASIVGEGQVVPEVDGLTSVGERGNLTVTDSQLNVSGEAGGTVYIRAGRLVLDNSAIAAKTLGAENGHEINLNVTSLAAIRGGSLSSSTSGSGNSGNINIQATDEIELSGENDQGVSGIFAKSKSQVDDNSEENIGNSGNILLTTNKLNLTGGAVITTSSYSTGNGGNILITANNTVNVSGEAISKNADGSDQVSGIFAQMYTENNNPPQSGMIDIRARQLQVTKGGAIDSSSFGTPPAGSINLRIVDDVVVSGTSSQGNSSEIAASVWGLATGDAGDLRLAARKLTVNGGAQIQSLTSGTGRGGDLYMDVKDIVISGFWHTVDENGADLYVFSGIYTLSINGNAGDITLTTEKLTLEQGGKITAQTDESGVAGNISIEALKGIYLSNQGGIFTESVDGHAGLIKLITPELHLKDHAKILATAKGKEPGGNIEIDVNHLHLTKGSEISASSESQGNAGNLRFIVGDTLVLEDSSIITEAQRSDGGNITITSPGYLRLTRSNISTSVKAENGNGGNIILQPTFIVLDDGQIIAKAVSGNGGHIDIKTVGIYNFLPEPLEEFINASSEFGLDGEVKINSPDTNVTESFVILPIGFLDVSVLLESCSRSYLKKNHSQFKINSLTGSPPRPEDLKANPLILF